MHAELHGQVQKETAETLAHGGCVHEPRVLLCRQAGKELGRAKRREADAVINEVERYAVFDLAFFWTSAIKEVDRPKALVRHELGRWNFFSKLKPGEILRDGAQSKRCVASVRFVRPIHVGQRVLVRPRGAAAALIVAAEFVVDINVAPAQTVSKKFL